MGGGMRRRVAGKKTEESELDTYKRLLKGDVKGFMEKQWTDAVSFVLVAGALLLFYPRTYPYAKPFFLPSHNVTTEFNITDEFGNTTDTREEVYYTTGPNDVLFYATLMPLWFILVDFFREATWWMFRAVIVQKEWQTQFRATAFHVLAVAGGMAYAYSLASEEGLFGITAISADYEKRNEMSIQRKTFCVVLTGYWSFRALCPRMYPDVKWKPGEQTFATLKGFAVSAAYGLAYYANFSRLTVVVALIDLFREFVESLLAAIKLAPPPPLSDKKKFHVDSSLPSHAEILEHGAKVEVGSEVGCRLLILLLVAYATGFDVVAIAVTAAVQVGLPAIQKSRMLVTRPLAVPGAAAAAETDSAP